MPFIIDDIILRMFGISVPPFDMIWLLENIQDFVIRTVYDPKKISDAIKENRLLYELEEITKEEYEKVQGELMERLKLAQRISETNLEHRVDVLNIGG